MPHSSLIVGGGVGRRLGTGDHQVADEAEPQGQLQQDQGVAEDRRPVAQRCRGRSGRRRRRWPPRRPGTGRRPVHRPRATTVRDGLSARRAVPVAGTSPSNFTGPPSPRRTAFPPARSAPAAEGPGSRRPGGQGVGDEGPPRTPGGVLVDGEGGVGRQEAEVELGPEGPGRGRGECRAWARSSPGAQSGSAPRCSGRPSGASSRPRRAVPPSWATRRTSAMVLVAADGGPGSRSVASGAPLRDVA